MLVDVVRLSLARGVYAMFYHCASRAIMCGVEARSVPLRYCNSRTIYRFHPIRRKAGLYWKVYVAETWGCNRARISSKFRSVGPSDLRLRLLA